MSQHRDIGELRPAELRTIVDAIRQILWFDFAKNEFDPDKEHSYDTLDYIAGVLEDHDLRPAEKETK
jgi:hypothetical protein